MKSLYSKFWVETEQLKCLGLRFFRFSVAAQGRTLPDPEKQKSGLPKSQVCTPDLRSSGVRFGSRLWRKWVTSGRVGRTIKFRPKYYD